MSKSNVDIDTSEIVAMFKDFTGKEQKKAYKTGLRRAANILVRETKKNFRTDMGSAAKSRNKWNGRTFESGIKAKISKDGKEAKIHILGDYRLKFFEKGTKKRYTRKLYKSKTRASRFLGINEHVREPRYRGKIKALHFFSRAKESKKDEVLHELDGYIVKSIKKISDKHR